MASARPNLRLAVLGCGALALATVVTLGWLVFDNQAPLALPADGTLRLERSVGVEEPADIPDGLSRLRAALGDGCVPVRDPRFLVAERGWGDRDVAEIGMSIRPADGTVLTVRMTGTSLAVRPAPDASSIFYRCAANDRAVLAALLTPADPTPSGAWLTFEDDGSCAVRRFEEGALPVELARLPGPCSDAAEGIVSPAGDRAVLQVGATAVLLGAKESRILPPLPGATPVRYGFDARGNLLAAGWLADVTTHTEGELRWWTYGGQTYTSPVEQWTRQEGALCRVYAEVGGAWLPIEVAPWDGEGPRVPCFTALDWRMGTDAMQARLDSPDRHFGEEAELQQWRPDDRWAIGAAVLPGADPARRFVTVGVSGRRYAFDEESEGPLWAEVDHAWKVVEGFEEKGPLELAAARGRLAACRDGHAAILVGGKASWQGEHCPIPWPDVPSPVPVQARKTTGATTWLVAEPIEEGCRVAKWRIDGTTEVVEAFHGPCAPPQVLEFGGVRWLAVGGHLSRDGAPYGQMMATVTLATDRDGLPFALEGRVTDGADACAIHALDAQGSEPEVVAGTCDAVASERGLTMVERETKHAEGTRWAWRKVLTAPVADGVVRLPVSVGGVEVPFLGEAGEPVTVEEQGEQLMVCAGGRGVLVDAIAGVVAAFGVCPAKAG